MSAVIDTLKATLLAAPDSWQCRLALVEALISEGQQEEAAGVLQGITELPSDLEDRVKAGRAYGFIDPQSGFEVFDGIITEMPSFAPAHFEKASLCVRSGDIEKGKQHYYTAATLDPALADQNLEAQLGLADSLVRPVTQTPVSEPAASEESPAAQPEIQTAEPTPLKPPPEAAPAVQSAEPVPLQPPPSEPATHSQPVEDPNVGILHPETSSELPSARHEIPVITLREALGLPPLRPLIDPESVPERPPLTYEESPVYHQPTYVPEEVYREQLNNVEVQPATTPEPVVYDYQAPDDSIFEPQRTDEGIYVGAVYNEAGEKIDDLFENLRGNQKEQADRIAATEKKDKVNSLAIASVAMVALCFLMVLVVTSVPRPAPPAIIATTPLPSQEDLMDNQQLNKPELQKQPMASSASAMSMDIVSVNSYSDMTMPTFEDTGISPGMANMGTDFGMSMSFGEAGGGGAMFFGGRSSGQRFLFVLDHSMSMTANQVKLRNDELERTLKGLRGVRYHVLLFAGGAYYVDKGWKAAAKQPTKYPTVFDSPDGQYSFKDSGLFDFKLNGDPKDFPSPRWLTASPSNIRRSIEEVKKAKKFGGTDWDTALQIGHLMDPPPDVIFFMTDGIDRQIDTKSIIRNSRGSGAPKINCVAMQTAAAPEEFSDIARRTNGSYTIVDKEGKPIDGFKYIKDPKDFADRLK